MALDDLLSEGWSKFKDSFKIQSTDSKGKPIEGQFETDWGQIASIGGLIGSATGLIGGDTTPPTGYQGSIPEYNAVRQRVPNTYDPNRRAGSSGQRYFTDMQYVPKVEGETPVEPLTAEGLAALNASNTAMQMKPASAITTENTAADTTPTSGGALTVGEGGLAVVPTYDDQGNTVKLAAGGIAQLKKGQYLNGATDGMADKIPANIDGVQEARLSDGEFVIPADVVSHLGNGNSDAGAKVLKDMMSRVRKTRTGNEKQGKEIDPKKFLPA